MAPEYWRHALVRNRLACVWERPQGIPDALQVGLKLDYGTHCLRAEGEDTSYRQVERIMTKAKGNRWSRRVTQTSNALDLEKNVFSKDNARGIALSLKRSADHSRRRKSSSYRSAMSMLTFYINRAGKNLPANRRAKLEAAKGEPRELYGKPRTRR